MKTRLQWNKKMLFTATAGSGHDVEMDSVPAFGGEDGAQRPKELVLDGLAGCSAMDVVSILKKMRIEPEDFRVDVDAEMSEEHPKVFTKIHMKYIFKTGAPVDKLEKAVNLSQEKYCGVSAMLKQVCELTYEVIVQD